MNACMCLSLSLFAFSCTASYGSDKPCVGRIVREGIVAGFPEGSKTDSGKILFFEPSAALIDNDTVVIANDKSIPSHSSLIRITKEAFSQRLASESFASPIDAAAFTSSQKLESFGGNASVGFAATDFEWITDDPKEADTYNNLLHWKDTLTQAIVVNQSEREGVSSSRDLRTSFARALQSQQFPKGPPYYKIEGMLVSGSDDLIFGVREIGSDYQNAIPTFILLRTKLLESGINVDTEFQKILEFNPIVPDRASDHYGISSLEPSLNQSWFVAVTSHEMQSSDQFDSVIWIVDWNADDASKPSLVVDSSGNIMHFPHKLECTAWLTDSELLLIADDDKTIWAVEGESGTHTRKPNEAYYYVVTIEH